MDWGLITGVLGLALSFFAMKESGWFFVAGVVLLIVSILLVLPGLFRGLRRTHKALFGPVPVLTAESIATSERVPAAQNSNEFADWLVTSVKAGRLELLCEIGASKQLGLIPAAYFEHHRLTLLFADNNNQVRTYDMRESLGDQDTDACYFNVHASRKVLKLITAARP